MADAIVTFEKVSKSYDGRTRVVDGLDLELARGEFLTLLGPSGSGKTTTLRLIAGFESPDEGRILLKGADVSAQPPYERAVNTVFQDYALFPHMTVGENALFVLVASSVPVYLAQKLSRGAATGVPGGEK